MSTATNLSFIFDCPIICKTVHFYWPAVLSMCSV